MSTDTPTPTEFAAEVIADAIHDAVAAINRLDDLLTDRLAPATAKTVLRGLGIDPKDKLEVGHMWAEIQRQNKVDGCKPNAHPFLRSVREMGVYFAVVMDRAGRDS